MPTPDAPLAHDMNAYQDAVCRMQPPAESAIGDGFWNAVDFLDEAVESLNDVRSWGTPLQRMCELGRVLRHVARIARDEGWDLVDVAQADLLKLHHECFPPATAVTNPEAQ